MKFKVGDRVAVYSFTGRDTGTVCELAVAGPHLKIESDHPTIDGNIHRVKAHVKQCRRLKPKRKLREFWIRHSPTFSSFAYETKRLALGSINGNMPEETFETIHVREIRRKP